MINFASAVIRINFFTANRFLKFKNCTDRKISVDKNLFAEISDVENLTVDLKNLDYIASAGLRILLKLKKRMDNQGSMKVINLNRDVREVFDMTGFSDLLLPDEEKNNDGFSVTF